MRKILDFELFIESLINGESSYYYSDRFRDVINKIASEKDPVAIIIQQSEGSDVIKDDITLIDLGELEDKVSFIQVNRLDRLRKNDKNLSLIPISDLSTYIKKVWSSTKSNLEHDSWKEQRTQIGVGRFANRVASNQKITIKSDQLEKFVNRYKSECKKIISDIENNFELIKGEDIRKYYLVDNHQEKKGQLFSSCMKYESCQPYFDIYVLNSDVCKMLVLRGDDKTKISGRALVWETTSGEIYMDRQYTNNDSDINLFIDYAILNGWGYYGDKKNIIYTVKLGDFEYNRFPYMDTFKYYNNEEKILTNDSSKRLKDGWWKLEETNGAYTNNRGYYSEIHKTFISEEDAVWATDVNSWVYNDEAVYVASIDEWYYSDKDLVFSDLEFEYILSDDAVYSETLNSYLTKDYSGQVWIKEGKIDWIPKLMIRNKAKMIKIDGKEKLCLLSSVYKNKQTGEWHFKEKI